MENKYYTPAIEDIRLGYEAEALLPSTDSWVCDTWTPFVIDPLKYSHYTPWQGDGTHFDDVVNKLSLKQIRTPYLTKEQIEAERWKVTDHVSGIWAECKQFTLRYEFLTCRLEIVNTDQEHIIYDGYCPSINEFRQITKLLGI